MFLFVTGPRGAGKTHFCRELLKTSFPPSIPGAPFGALAFLSIRLNRDEGYDLEIVSYRPSDEVERRVVPLIRLRATNPGWGGPTLGPWTFSPGAFAEALKVFDREFSRLVRGDLLVLDEVGPLELVLDGGFMPILSRAASLPRVVVVVRPDLISSLRKVLTEDGAKQSADVEVVHIDPGAHNHEDAYQATLSWCGEFLGRKLKDNNRSGSQMAPGH